MSQSATVIEGLPTGPRVPVALQTLAMRTRQRPFLERARRRYGSMLTVQVLGLGKSVVVSDPALIKQAFRADPTVLHAGTGSPLRPLLGPNSLLGIDEDQHMEQRKLLLPPFKGQRMKQYESMIAEIAAEEIDQWPDCSEFATARSMQRGPSLAPRAPACNPLSSSYRSGRRWGRASASRRSCGETSDPGPLGLGLKNSALASTAFWTS
jgi:Cytochrome P450